MRVRGFRTYPEKPGAPSPFAPNSLALVMREALSPPGRGMQERLGIWTRWRAASRKRVPQESLCLCPVGRGRIEPNEVRVDAGEGVPDLSGEVWSPPHPLRLTRWRS